MIKAMTVNNTVVCVINGKMYQKATKSSEDKVALYEQICNTKEDNAEEVSTLIKEFVNPKRIAEIERVEEKNEKIREANKESTSVAEWMESLPGLEDDLFRSEGSKLYLKGVNISIPLIIAKEIEARKDSEEELMSIINFWKKCALNPDPRVREDLLSFIQRNELALTPEGQMVAYRNANIVEGGSTSSEFDVNLHQAALEMKAVLVRNRQSVNSFYVYTLISEDNKKFHKFHKRAINLFESNKDVIILETVGDILSRAEVVEVQETIYTDAHSGTTRIKLNEIVSIDKSECDTNPNKTCSRG